jgi:hypothetical protein
MEARLNSLYSENQIVRILKDTEVLLAPPLFMI